MGRLDQLDLSLKLSGAEELERLAAAQKRLARLRLELGMRRRGFEPAPEADREQVPG